MTTKLSKICPLKRLFVKSALGKIAKELARASEKIENAGDDVLYRLPGVFSMSLVCGGQVVRLIKEANAFRVMKSSEKSEVSLSAKVTDEAALADLCSKKATWQKVYSEGRIVFAGKMKYATLFMRVMAEGDKAFLSAKKYLELYGE